MRRAGLLAGLGAAVALALTGCVGIPLSGGVEAGRPINEQLDPEVVVLPSGPVPGADREAILEGFMQAVRGPQNGYAIARQFLTDELNSEWDPDAGTLIRRGPATVLDSGPDTITYAVTTEATVNEEGRYEEVRGIPSEADLSFSFEQVDGEWRISQAENGIVLSESSFRVAFREQSLYFFDPSFGYLVPDVRWFPARPTTSVRVVEALLAGPTSWLQGAAFSAFPPGAALGDGSVVVGTAAATVDLSTEVLAASPEARDRMRQQLAATLGYPNIDLTVSGRQLPTPDTGVSQAIQYPAVDGPALIGTGSEFGFDAGSGISPLEGLAPAVVAAGAVSADLSTDKAAVALLSGAGGVYLATAGDAAAAIVDPRPGLIAPAIDPFRFVWSVPADDPAGLTAFEGDGAEHPVQSGLPAGSRVVSMDISRDGARILFYLSTPIGPQLFVAGIIRQDEVPLRLGELLQLPVPDGEPVDAAWVDNRSVAAAALSPESAPVTVLEIGGPSTSLGQVEAPASIVGGNGGTDGLRILNSVGEVWRPQGGRWVATGITAAFLATKQ